MLSGVVITESKAQKDELILEGNDIDMVSQSGTSLFRPKRPTSHKLFFSCIYPGYLPSAEQGYS
jgi:hypothetical protein